MSIGTETKKKKDNHTGLERHDGADSLKW